MMCFFIQKFSWNNINKFLYIIFNWVVLDGLQVICYMLLVEIYMVEVYFGDVKCSMLQYKFFDQDLILFFVFGKGDGGGGFIWQYFEKFCCVCGISDMVGFFFWVYMGSLVDDFFYYFEVKGDKFVMWYGELYFELYCGIYIIQFNNKCNNCRVEDVFCVVELLVIIVLIEGYCVYFKKEIDEMWELVFFCQFYDCLFGSLIEMCYYDFDEVRDLNLYSEMVVDMMCRFIRRFLRLLRRFLVRLQVFVKLLLMLLC